MSLTFASLSPNPDTVVSNKRLKFRKVTFDSSYPTGGEAVTAANVGLRKIQTAIVQGTARKSDNTLGLSVSWDHTNSKLIAFRQKDPADPGGADIPFPEVGDTIDLSAYSVHVLFIGY